MKALLAKYGITEADYQAITVKFSNNDILITEGGKDYSIDEWVTHHVASAALAKWGDSDITNRRNSISSALDIGGEILDFYDKMCKDEDDAYAKQTFDLINTELPKISAKIDTLQKTLVEGIKKIINYINYDRMKGRFDSLASRVTKLESRYFHATKQTEKNNLNQEYLNVYNAVMSGKYSTNYIDIDTKLHQVYSNGITVSPFSGLEYASSPSYKTDYYNDFKDIVIDMTKTTYTKDDATTPTNIFQLSHGVIAYTAVFNTETFDSREKIYNAYRSFFEKNYVICGFAMAYNMYMHEAYKDFYGLSRDLTSKLNPSQEQKSRYEQIDREIQQKIVNNESSRFNIKTGLDELKGYYKTLILDENSYYNTEIKKLKTEKENTEKADGYFYCYVTQSNYRSTLYQAAWNEERETFQAYDQDPREFLDYTTNQKYPEYYLNTKVTALHELNLSDWQLSNKSSIYKSAVPQAKLEEINNYAKERSTTLRKALNNKYLKTTNKNKTTQSMEKFDLNVPVYVDGYQRAGNFGTLKPGCGDYIYHKIGITRYIQNIDQNGNLNLTEAARKVWQCLQPEGSYNKQL